MHFYGFLNRKLRKSSIKVKGRRIIRALHVTMDEKLNLKWRVEGSERVSSLKEFSKFSKFLRNEVVKVPNKRLNYLYPLHKPFKGQEAAIQYKPSHTILHSKWHTHGSDLIKPFIQGPWLKISVPHTSGLDQRYWWHLGNTNQEYTPSSRYSSTTIAFTRVTQKPKVMSPQPFLRDVGINCGMTIDQTSWRGNLWI